MTAVTYNFLGGQFALSAHTPRSAAPLRSAASLWGNRCYRGRNTVFVNASALTIKSRIFAA